MSSPSENSFVKDFQNLHVLGNAYDLERMDELVQDLTNALEETLRGNDGEVSENSMCRRRQRCRQRSRRRPRSTVKQAGNISEASESSIDEAIKDLMEMKSQHSDSDDLLMSTRRMTSLQNHTTISLAESDSVTENFSPNRPHRRRKRGKRMAVDRLDTEVELKDGEDFQQFEEQSVRPAKSRTLDTKVASVMNTRSGCGRGSMVPGKRKRMEGGYADSCYAASPDNHDGAGTSHMDCGISYSSSCPSSSESDHGAFTNDEGRDADDEHSDFFHEPGPACGVIGIIPWWEQNAPEDDPNHKDPSFEQILNGSFDYLSKSSKRSFRSRVSRLLARNREIRASRRRLKERRGQHQYNWLKQEPYSRAELGKKHGLALPSSLDHSVAKYRGTSPPSGRNSCDDAGFVGQDADPIPSSNIGSQMLQNMGWTPGTGLGSDSMGITTPIMAFKRPKRRGLGALSDS